MSKLYVGNLTSETTEQDLREAFAAYQPTSVSLIMDRATGQSKGFGFVTCGSDELASEATQASIEVNGRMLRIDVARPPSDSRGPGNFSGGRKPSNFGGKSSYGNRNSNW